MSAAAECVPEGLAEPGLHAHAAEGPPAQAQPAVSQGYHWVMDFAGCACDARLLAEVAALRDPCVAACRQAGMHVVGDRFHQFSPQGVTGVVLLAESHLAIHTWPEHRFVALDVYVCDHSAHNRDKGQALVRAMSQLLAPASASMRELPRGSVRSPATTR